MTTLIVGSTAARHWFPDWREPKDLDVYSDHTPENTGRADVFWDERLRDWILDRDHRSPRWWGADCHATPDELYTIKHSHAYWELENGSWSKHMHDLLELQRRGAQLIPELHDLLYKVWEDTHGKKVVDLTKEAEDFFADAVKRPYEHDSIHLSVAYTPGKPLYDEALKPGKTVQMDMATVWSWPYAKQVQLFREEVYVTALERLVIPSNYRHSPGAAYQWALRRTITSLTKGKSARFMVSNFEDFRQPGEYVGWHLANKHYLIPLEG